MQFYLAAKDFTYTKIQVLSLPARNGKKLSLTSRRIRLRVHGIVSERFHSELIQKAPDLFTQFNENQHKPGIKWLRRRLA